MTAKKDLTGIGAKMGLLIGGLYFLVYGLIPAGYISTMLALYIAGSPLGGSFMAGLMAMVFFASAGFVSMMTGGIAGVFVESMIVLYNRKNAAGNVNEQFSPIKA
ncbi:MAG: hypothetical protein EPN22_11635 [Nitrospirae bacterium]|nr:MAG: hypothetical protein EPN22_11635 [Nitrospirota bacterium]